MVESQHDKPSGDDTTPFVRFDHPKGWYHLERPEHWDVLMDEDGAVQFSDPAYPQSVALLIFRLDIPVDARAIQQSGKWPEVAQALFAQMGSTELTSEPSLSLPCYSARRSEPNEAGKRMFVLANEHVLGVSISMPVDNADHYKVDFDRMLSSLYVPETASIGPMELMEMVRQQLKAQLPDWHFQIENQKIVSGVFEISIGNLISQVNTYPDKCGELVDRFVEGIAKTIQSQQQLGQEDYLDVQHAFLPLLKPEKYVRDVDQMMLMKREGDGDGQLASQAWLDGIQLVYAIDSETSFRFVNLGDLRRWDVAIDELHARAMINLSEAPSPSIEVYNSPDGSQKFGFVRVEKGAASSYLLYPSLYPIASQQIGRGIVAAIPNRDTIVLFQDSGNYEQLRDAVMGDYQRSQHAISPQLFRLTPDGVVPIDTIDS
jgi:hypothetical protein